MTEGNQDLHPAVSSKDDDQQPLVTSNFPATNTISEPTLQALEEFDHEEAHPSLHPCPDSSEEEIVERDKGSTPNTEESHVGTFEPQATPKKRKKRSKPKSRRGLGKPSGFEEFYVDAPVTPDEAIEEQELYDVKKPIDQRVLTAVQRFSARRKLDSEQKEIFDRYLKFGGIDTGPKAFSGGVDLEDSDLTAAEITSIKATQSLSKAVSHGHMVVDFDGVLKAFLSCNSSSYFIGIPDKDTKRFIHVIRNFLNYLLHHDVCSEYREQIEAAKRTCDVGESQLHLLGQSSRLLPGQFNVACSTLFNGWYHLNYNDNSNLKSDNEVDTHNMSSEQAKKCFVVGMACNSSEEAFQQYQQHTEEMRKQPLRQFSTGLEVTKIALGNEDVRRLYGLPICQGYKPIGKVKTRTWRNPAGYAQDLLEEEEEQLATTTTKPEEYEFWLEEEILEKMFVGMKLEAEVYETTFGIHFFDIVSLTACSFFDFIPNEMMVGWRDHIYLPPSEGDEPELEVDAADD